VISGDGAVIAFHSAAPGLVTGDTNGRDDVFVHELGVADITPPIVTGAAATPPNANGWYNGNVTIHWTATDPEPSSGQPAAVPDTTASTEGANQTFTSPPACDGNANCATGTIKLSIDKTPPVATASTNSVNTNGWYNADVVVGFTCSDSLSGVASCPGAVHFTAEGANQTIPAAGRTAIDRAGNTTVVPVAPVSIDETPPTVTFSGATSYDVDGTVSITCVAADALSGIASTTCTPVSGPAYLFNIGTNVITATATDKAGNVTSATYSFTVTATIGGLERFTCSLLGTGTGKQKQLADLCRKLSDDLEDAKTAAASGDIKKRDENIPEVPQGRLEQRRQADHDEPDGRAHPHRPVDHGVSPRSGRGLWAATRTSRYFPECRTVVNPRVRPDAMSGYCCVMRSGPPGMTSM